MGDSSFFLVCSLLSFIVVHYARDCSCTCTCTHERMAAYFTSIHGVYVDVPAGTPTCACTCTCTYMCMLTKSNVNVVSVVGE